MLSRPVRRYERLLCGELTAAKSMPTRSVVMPAENRERFKLAIAQPK